LTRALLGSGWQPGRPTVTLTFNRFAEINYGFLNGKPATPSHLDVLGPWPVYVLSATVLILIVWALMRWPWQRVPKHQTPGSGCGSTPASRLRGARRRW
jgi:hypothetical protein